MKKLIKIKFLMVLTICIISAVSVFCAGRNTLSAHAYTDEEIAAAKEWLAANGYSPSRAGAEQAYQDYLNGKFGPVQGTETPPAENTPPADDASAETGKENGSTGTPESDAQQPEGEQPGTDAPTDEESQTSSESEPQPVKNTADSAELREVSDTDTDPDAQKQETESDTQNNEAAASATSKNNASATGTQNKDTAADKNPDSLEDDADDSKTDDSTIDLASAAETPDTTTVAAGTAAVSVPDESSGDLYFLAVLAALLVVVSIVSLIIYLRKKNERTAS